MENLYEELFRRLNELEIAYVVVGGVAVNLHGYSRYTGDVDLLLALTEENLERMASLMDELGYTQRLPVKLTDLARKEQVHKWLAEKGMTAYAYIHPRMPQFSVDILAGESLDFASYNERKVFIDAWHLPIPVISIDDLLGMKRKTNREKDIEDVEALLQLKSL